MLSTMQIFVSFSLLPTCYLLVSYSTIFVTFHHLPHQIFIFLFSVIKKYRNP
nr:MAG TPA: hypothetical protein [Caudoviricetes sp.]